MPGSPMFWRKANTCFRDSTILCCPRPWVKPQGVSYPAHGADHFSSQCLLNPGVCMESAQG